MYCAISGEVPLEPVVSAKSGHVFEKRLILKALEASSNQCPATGGELKPSDLISVQADVAVRPKPLTGTSLPGMMAMFQNEWDEVMLETHQLKQQLYSTRKELSHALYQHDAACRVIARLSSERDEARANVAELQRQVAELVRVAESNNDTNNRGSASMDVENDHKADFDSVTEQLTTFWQEASKARKARKKNSVSSTLASRDEISRWGMARSLELFGQPPQTAATALAHLPDSGQLLAGGSNGDIVLVDTSTGAFGARSSSFSSAVLAIAPMLGGRFASCDASTVAVFETVGGERTELLAASNGMLLNGVACHPSGRFCLAQHNDASFAFVSIDTKQTLYRTGSANSTATARPVFHPDGLIAAQATSSPSDGHLVRVWDVRERANVHNFQGHDASVSAITFSENGYYMASSSADASLRIWDLRNRREIHKVDADKPLTACAFDFSGKYLAAASHTTLAIAVVKEWTTLSRLPLAGPPTDITFLPDAKALAAAGSPGVLEVFQDIGD